MSNFLGIPDQNPSLEVLNKIILAQEEQEKCSLKEQIENMMKEKKMISNTYHDSDGPSPLYRLARNAFMEESDHKRVINNKGDYAHFNANGSGYLISWGIYHAQNDMIIFYYTDQYHELNIQEHAPTSYVHYLKDDENDDENDDYDEDGKYKKETIVSTPIDWYTGEEISDAF